MFSSQEEPEARRATRGSTATDGVVMLSASMNNFIQDKEFLVYPTAEHNACRRLTAYTHGRIPFVLLLKPVKKGDFT